MDKPSYSLSEIFADKISGKSFLRRQQQKEELEHERQLAEIRTRSHALVWTGTVEELNVTITKWYELGQIVAESLADALQKASIHFMRPDGTLVIVRDVKAGPAPESQWFGRFRPLDEDYQVIEFEKCVYELTPTQSTIIRVLHKAHIEKRGSVGIKEIYKALQINSGKMSGWFRDKKNKHLYGKLVVQTASRTHYRLDI